MAFFFGNLRLENVLVAGVRQETSKKTGKQFVVINVCDSEGNSNQLSTSEPEQMREALALHQGDRVDLRIVCAGGPNRQYAMISRKPGSIMPSSGGSD